MAKKEAARPVGTDSARVIQVIQTIARIGDGTEANPNRYLTEYWSLEGELLAVSDPEAKTV